MCVGKWMAEMQTKKGTQTVGYITFTNITKISITTFITQMQLANNANAHHLNDCMYTIIEDARSLCQVLVST